MFKNLLLTTASLAFMGTGSMAQTAWATSDLQQPESVVVDAERSQIIISNIAGAPNEANGTGFLSAASLNGEITNLHWADGMNAPKGMAIMGGQLFVADINLVHIVDMANGKIVQSLDAEGAVFLNDVTASGDTVWISDMMTHTIWQFTGGALTKFLQTPDLNHPNGLLFDGNRLVVGTWGPGMKPDFSTEAPGSLIAIDLKSKAISPIAGGEAIGNLDGVVRIGDALVVNDWITGKVFALKPGEKAKEVAQYAQGLADIGAAGATVYLPMMMDGKLGVVDATDWLK